MVLLEALDLSSGHLRRLVLGKGLLLTQRNPERGRVERLEMPECIACCELEAGRDGRLVLLFADSQIRIVELRMDTLALQEATYRNMMGRRDAEDTTAGRTQLKEVQEQAGKLIKEAREPCFEEDIAEFLEKASEVNKVEKMKMELKDFDHAKYDELFKAVEKEILQLRVVLQSIEARERERTWLRGKVVGEFDDNKIVDLAIGEKNVFKRRGQREDRSLIQSLLKRLSFVVDVSGSMAVFNGDGRLDRLCATMVMIMESLCGLEHKYIYEIIGHSGESDWLPFVQMGQHPATRLERFAVVEAMTDHAATARSGDNTLAAGVKAVQEIVKEDADDYFVFLISDANLRGYGISAEDLAMALTGEVKVNAHAIFIAEPDAAEEMRRCMPQGHAHLVMETSGMPLLLKNIFARAVLATSNSKL
ncbi:unnamed protein product [Durusdinium trenchii]|uniref:VWFA domain-containing protein n=1 Tax=Durusdinium trenchii TaxID=1381693 RepID=A0ABP0NTI9_9DINO